MALPKGNVLDSPSVVGAHVTAPLQLKSIHRSLAKAQDESSSSMAASQFIGNKAADKLPSDSGGARQDGHHDAPLAVLQQKYPPSARAQAARGAIAYASRFLWPRVATLPASHCVRCLGDRRPFGST